MADGENGEQVDGAGRAAALTKPGRYGDGQGLYLSISSNGGRRWVLLFAWQGRTREMGLGSARDVTLSRARELAAAARREAAEGRDPIAGRKLAVAVVTTFGAFSDELVASLESGWRNAKHRFLPVAADADPLCSAVAREAARHDLDERCPRGSETDLAGQA